MSKLRCVSNGFTNGVLNSYKEMRIYEDGTYKRKTGNE